MASTYPDSIIELLINYFVICASSFFISVYVYNRSQNLRLKKVQRVYLIVSGLILSSIFAFVHYYNAPLSHFLRFLFIPLLLSFLSEDKKNLVKQYAIGFIALSFVTICEYISLIPQSIIMWLFKIGTNALVSCCITSILSFIQCVCIMHIERLKRGFQFFQEEKNLGLGLIISSVIMVFKSVNLRDNQDKDYFFFFIIVGTLIAGFGLYLWIRQSITALYRNRQQLRTEKHYQAILEEREKEIEKLNQSNAYLAKIVHRDNHLMSNVNTSIDMYFNSDDEAHKETLLRELQTLAKERNEVINKEQLKSKLLPSTGNLLIDGAINDLYIKAAAHGIDFNLTVTSTVDEIIGKYISQTDLQTLLCDHIKDAIIAVDSYGESGGKILVNLSKQNDNYCIDIYDSGVAFEPDTLSKLGMERVTTHADSGGSGIGFMTTFETIKKAYASLIITEFEHRSPFSKSVSFRFDGESAFIINSYRKDELQQLIKRNDVIYL